MEILEGGGGGESYILTMSVSILAMLLSYTM